MVDWKLDMDPSVDLLWVKMLIILSKRIHDWRRFLGKGGLMVNPVSSR